MALNEYVKANFETLQRAFDDSNVCLMECTDIKTGEKVPVVCAVEIHGEEYVLIPFAKLFIGDPYEELEPPL